VHISNSWSKTIGVSFLVEKIDTKDRIADLADLDVSKKDNLSDPD